MKSFALGVVAGMASVFGGLVVAYAAVATLWPNSLPAPALTQVVHMDEKLRFVRERPDLRPRILAVGSSIAWRQLDGTALDSLAGRAGGVFNGGTAALQIHQTQELLKFYLGRYESVQTALVLTGPVDFENCSSRPARIFDHEDAMAYAFDSWPAGYFYLRYFSPQRYLRTALTLDARRKPYAGDLFLDEYGSGPLVVPASKQRGLRYKEVKLDPACVDALITLSHEVAELGVHLVITFPPIHPDYRRAYPETMQALHRTIPIIEQAVKKDGTRLILLVDDPSFVPEDFFDAFHLQWPAVQRLSAIIAEALRKPGDSLGKKIAERNEAQRLRSRGENRTH